MTEVGLTPDIADIDVDICCECGNKETTLPLLRSRDKAETPFSSTRRYCNVMGFVVFEYELLLGLLFELAFVLEVIVLALSVDEFPCDCAATAAAAAATAAAAAC